MYRIIAILVTALFCTSTWAKEPIGMMTDEACANVYNITEVVTRDVVINSTIDTLDYNSVFQAMSWGVSNDLNQAEGIRKHQLVDAQIAIMWLREKALVLQNTIKRSFNKHNQDSTDADVIAIEVAETMTSKCESVQSFRINPFTRPIQPSAAM